MDINVLQPTLHCKHCVLDFYCHGHQCSTAYFTLQALCAEFLLSWTSMFYSLLYIASIVCWISIVMDINVLQPTLHCKHCVLNFYCHGHQCSTAYFTLQALCAGFLLSWTSMFYSLLYIASIVCWISIVMDINVLQPTLHCKHCVLDFYCHGHQCSTAYFTLQALCSGFLLSWTSMFYSLLYIASIVCWISIVMDINVLQPTLHCKHCVLNFYCHGHQCSTAYFTLQALCAGFLLSWTSMFYSLLYIASIVCWISIVMDINVLQPTLHCKHCVLDFYCHGHQCSTAYFTLQALCSGFLLSWTSMFYSLLYIASIVCWISIVMDINVLQPTLHCKHCVLNFYCHGHQCSTAYFTLQALCAGFLLSWTSMFYSLLYIASIVCWISIVMDINVLQPTLHCKHCVLDFYCHGHQCSTAYFTLQALCSGFLLSWPSMFYSLLYIASIVCWISIVMDINVLQPTLHCKHCVLDFYCHGHRCSTAYFTLQALCAGFLLSWTSMFYSLLYIASIVCWISTVMGIDVLQPTLHCKHCVLDFYCHGHQCST